MRRPELNGEVKNIYIYFKAQEHKVLELRMAAKKKKSLERRIPKKEHKGKRRENKAH